MHVSRCGKCLCRCFTQHVALCWIHLPLRCLVFPDDLESCFHVSGIEWQCVLTNFATWNDLEWPAQRVIWSWERYNNSANVSERAVTKTTWPSFSPRWQRQNLAVKACGLLTILRPGKRGRILILTYLTGVEIRIHPVLSRVGDEASKHLPTLGRKDAFPWNLMKFALKTFKTCDSRCCDGMVRRTGRLKQRQERSEKPFYFVALPQPFFLVKSATRKRFSLLCDSCNGLGWLRQRWLWMGLPSNDDDAMGQRQGKGRPFIGLIVMLHVPNERMSKYIPTEIERKCYHEQK